MRFRGGETELLDQCLDAVLARGNPLGAEINPAAVTDWLAPDPPANTVPCFQHRDTQTGSAKQARSHEAGQAGPHDDDIPGLDPAWIQEKV